MRKLQRVAVAAALAAAGLGVAGVTANAATAAPGHRTQAATASWNCMGSSFSHEIDWMRAKPSSALSAVMKLRRPASSRMRT